MLRRIVCFDRVKMAAQLYQAISPSPSTFFGSIDGHVKAGAPVFVGAASSIGKRKNQNGVEYYVHRFYGGAGTQQETYLVTIAHPKSWRMSLHESGIRQGVLEHFPGL